MNSHEKEKMLPPDNSWLTTPGAALGDLTSKLSAAEDDHSACEENRETRHVKRSKYLLNLH